MRPLNPDKVPSKLLATEEQQDAFCEDVINKGGIKPATKAWGMTDGPVYYWSQKHTEFRKKLDMALAANRRLNLDRIDELMSELLKMEPKQMALCANAYRVAADHHKWVIGKLDQVFSDKAQAAINITAGAGSGVLVCTDEQREKLIQLREKLLTERAAKKAEVISNERTA